LRSSLLIVADVPEETHAALRRRAAAAHQSRQEYLWSWLIDEADRLTLAKVLDRASGRAGGSVPLKTAVGQPGGLCSSTSRSRSARVSSYQYDCARSGNRRRRRIAARRKAVLVDVIGLSSS
jgi:hypothetical protein